MNEKNWKNNIEWLIEQYRKVRSKSYIGVLIIAGISLIIGPDWWQSLTADFLEDLYGQYINPNYIKQVNSTTNEWLGFILIFVAIAWHLILQKMELKKPSYNSEEIAGEIHGKIFSRTKDEWREVITRALNYVDRIEGWFYVGFRALSRPSQEYYKLAWYGHKKIKENWVELENLISHLPPDLKPGFVQLLSTIDILFKKFEFVTLIYEDKQGQTDFILSSPLSELSRLTLELESLAKIYDFEIRLEGKDKNLKEDSKLAWKDFVKNNPMFDNPSEYKATRSRNIYAFDIKTMQLLVGGVEIGMEIRTYISN